MRFIQRLLRAGGPLRSTKPTADRRSRPVLEVLEDRTVMDAGDFSGTAIPLSLVNNTNAFASNQVYLAVYGQVISIPTPGVPPPPGVSYFLDATKLGTDGTPVPQATTTLPLMSAATPDQVQLPSFSIQQWTTAKKGGPTPLLGLPVPASGKQFTGRIVISAGVPAQVQVANMVNNDPATRTVGAPSANNPTDTSSGTFYDFLEFTVTNPTSGPVNLDVDTSLVDSFGMPMTLQFTYLDGGMTKTAGPVGVVQSRGVIMSAGTASALPNLSFQGFLKTQALANGDAAVKPFQQSFNTLTASAGNRLVSPKDVIESHANDPDYATKYLFDPLNTYFDSTFNPDGSVKQLGVLDQFFLKYTPTTAGLPGAQGDSLVLTGSDNTTKYVGQVMQITQSATKQKYWVLRFTKNGEAQTPADKKNTTDTTNTFDVYYPYFRENTLGRASAFYPQPKTSAPPPAPPAITVVNLQRESPTGMVFACNGVFADNTTQFPSDPVRSNILGDIENQISAALNRGIALNQQNQGKQTWDDKSTFYDASKASNGGLYNYWVQFWHQDGMNAPPDNQAYAFPYDDRGGYSTNLQQNNPQKVTITLGSWGTTKSTATTVVAFPTTVSPGQQVTLSAQVLTGGAAATGTVTFFINGVAVNSGDAGPHPQPQPVPLVLVPPGKIPMAQLTAVLPALPDGSHSHSFNVTAVYSGDANFLPSVGIRPALQLTGNAGIPLTVTSSAPSGPVGSMVTLTATYGLPLPTGGQVQFGIYDVTGANLLKDLGKVTPNNNKATLATTIDVSPPAGGPPVLMIRATYLSATGTKLGDGMVSFTVTAGPKPVAFATPSAFGSSAGLERYLAAGSHQDITFGDGGEWIDLLAIPERKRQEQAIHS